MNTTFLLLMLFAACGLAFVVPAVFLLQRKTLAAAVYAAIPAALTTGAILLLVEIASKDKWPTTLPFYLFGAALAITLIELVCVIRWAGRRTNTAAPSN